MKKLVLAAVVTYIVLMASNYLINSILLMPDYNAIPLSHRSMEGIMHRFWALALGQLFYAIFFVYIYARGAEHKSWPAQGVRYGIVMTLFTVIPVSLTQYDIYIVPYMLAIKWMVAGALQMLLLGIIVAAIYKQPQSA